MKKHRKSRLRHRPLFVEGLEMRAMLAGNVTATVSGETLFVTGDNSDNAVVIQQTGTNQFTVVGAAASGTTINGTVEGTAFIANNVRNFEIDLRGGNDSLGISNSDTFLIAVQDELLGGAQADVGLPEDALTLRGYANIRTGLGDDAIAVQLQAGGSIFIGANAGSDAVVVEGSSATSLVINADTGYQATDGDDYVRVRGTTTTVGSIVVNTFAGNDNVLLADDTSAASIVANAGVGFVSNGALDFDLVSAARLIAGGNVTILGGGNDDALTLSDIDANFLLVNGGRGSDAIAVGSLDVANASLIGEVGNDTITLDDATNPEDPLTPLLVDDTTATSVTGLLHIDAGSGDDAVSVNGDATFHPQLGRLNVWTFGGTDTVSLANIDLTGNALVDLGIGVDTLTAVGLTTPASVLVFGGADADTLTLTDISARYLLAVGGGGNDAINIARLDVVNATIVGELGDDVITVDDTLNAEDPTAPILVDDTNFTTVTGLLHIDAGAGNDTVNVTGDALFNPSLGRLNVWTFGGNDTVSLTNLSLTGNVAIDLGIGTDDLTMDAVATDAAINAFLLDGDDTATISNTTAAGGTRARFFGGAGFDTFNDGGGNGVQGTDYFLFSFENVTIP
jgi:hypothetical protein